MSEQDLREKVINGLECCVAYDYKCNDCPYQDDGGAEDGCYSDELKADALALLKAQELVSVQKKQNEMFGLQTWDWVCGNCGQIVLFSANFCPWCGRAVKWE